MKIAKIHSLGNDFLIIDEKVSGQLEERGSFARKICERHTGVGADGMLLIHIEDKKKSIVHFRVFNADGTEAELSGNGLRCAAAYLYYKRKDRNTPHHLQHPGRQTGLRTHPTRQQPF